MQDLSGTSKNVIRLDQGDLCTIVGSCHEKDTALVFVVQHTRFYLRLPHAGWVSKQPDHWCQERHVREEGRPNHRSLPSKSTCCVAASFAKICAVDSPSACTQPRIFPQGLGLSKIMADETERATVQKHPGLKFVSWTMIFHPHLQEKIQDDPDFSWVRQA